MSDKEKEVVFKLSFSKHKDSSKKKEQPKMVTVWNYKRIGTVLIILFVLIILVISIFLNDDLPTVTKNNSLAEKTKTNSNTPSIKSPDSIAIKETQPTVIVNLPTMTESSNKTPTQIFGSVVRAQLAKGIWQNEPFRLITGPIKVNSEEATGLFYFTELENMKDQSIFHIWRYKGDIIFKKQKHVIEDQWQTYTSKLFTKRSIGPWSVETVDSNNRQLDLIDFNVISATD